MRSVTFSRPGAGCSSRQTFCQIVTEGDAAPGFMRLPHNGYRSFPDAKQLRVGVLHPHAHRKTRGKMDPVQSPFDIRQPGGNFSILRKYPEAHTLHDAVEAAL